MDTELVKDVVYFDLSEDIAYIQAKIDACGADLAASERSRRQLALLHKAQEAYDNARINVTKEDAK